MTLVETNRDDFIETCNTIKSPVVKEKVIKKQSLQLINWFFTFNNYTIQDIEILETKFKDICLKYIFQEEIGKCGTKHLQGCIKLKKPMRWSEFGLNKEIHWEKTKSTKMAEEYCQKVESRNGKIYSMGVKIKKEIKTLSEEQLYDWQKEIIEIIKGEPDDRTIYWYWEPIGKMGKTTFSKYLSIKYGAIPVEGKKNDILCCASEYDSEIYIFDFERSMEEYISYGAIEKIKNGYYMCSKYESNLL